MIIPKKARKTRKCLTKVARPHSEFPVFCPKKAEKSAKNAQMFDESRTAPQWIFRFFGKKAEKSAKNAQMFDESRTAPQWIFRFFGKKPKKARKTRKCLTKVARPSEMRIHCRRFSVSFSETGSLWFSYVTLTIYRYDTIPSSFLARLHKAFFKSKTHSFF